MHPTKAGGSAVRWGTTGTERQTGYLKKASELLAQLPTRTQMDELLAKAVKHLEQMSEQAGKRKRGIFLCPASGCPDWSAGHSMDQSAVGAWRTIADWAGAVGGVVQLGHALRHRQGPAPVKDATTTHHQNNKALRKERKENRPRPRKEDDHEEEQTWQQSM